MEPPRHIPTDLLSAYTMNGQIRTEDWYINDSQTDNITKYYKKSEIENLIAKAHRREQNYYEATDSYLFAALDAFPIDNQDVVVMGSQVPWYESICLARNVKSCTTIEYWTVDSEDSRLTYITPSQYDQNPRQFDAGISISSFEHDGLGRYGDPLDPDADLKAMLKMKSIIKPGGILYLAVPVAQDKLVWNAHRVYGRLRLPHLLAGWEIQYVYGFSEQLLDTDTGKNGPFQPVWVLKNSM
jgi:SAM-dependent methyltransferase